MSFWDSLASSTKGAGNYLNPGKLGQQVANWGNDALNDVGLHPLAQVTTAPAQAISRVGNMPQAAVERNVNNEVAQIPGLQGARDLSNINGNDSIAQMHQNSMNQYNQNTIQPLARAFGGPSPAAQPMAPSAQPAQMNQSSQPMQGQQMPPPMQAQSPMNAYMNGAPQNGFQGAGGPMQANPQWNPMAYKMPGQS